MTLTLMKPSSVLSIQNTISVNKEFVVNVDMQGCSDVDMQGYTQLSKNSCGGCAIYINPQITLLEMTFQHWKRNMKHYGLR